MSDLVFNVAKGRVNGYVDRVVNNDPVNSAIILVLLQAAEADAVIEDHDNLSLLLGAAGNTEAAFTNYSRKVLTDADLSAPTVDDVNDRQESTVPTQTWVGAGGAVNNTMVRALFCYDPDTTSGDDSNIVPLTASDFTPQTNGNDLIMNVPNGFFRAS